MSVPSLSFRNFCVRSLCTKDTEAVEKLVSTIDKKENILEDVSQYNIARRDTDGTEIQAFVAECHGQWCPFVCLWSIDAPFFFRTLCAPVYLTQYLTVYLNQLVTIYLTQCVTVCLTHCVTFILSRYLTVHLIQCVIDNLTQSVTVYTSGQVVGVAVVRREEEMEYIRSHYNIEDFIYYNHHRYYFRFPAWLCL